MRIVYESNGRPVGDGLRVTRVTNGGQRIEVLVDEKEERYSALKLLADEEPQPDPVPVPDPTPEPEPDPDPVPDPDPTPDPGQTPQPDADYIVGAGGDFASIGAAIAAVQSGSVVMVKAGTYREGTIQISRDNIHVYGEPGAVLDSTARSGNAITVTGDYVTVESLEIKNAGQDGIEFNHCHHGAVRNCHIHHCDESGIQTNYGDAFTFEGNTCHNNAASGHYSGISLYQNRPLAPAGAERYRNVIRGNTCYRNFTERGNHTDGNGIIVDDFRNTQNNSPAGNYPYWTLVEDNVCYENGGKGVQVFSADLVTVRRNVCYHNGTDPLDSGTWRGELSAAFADDVEFIDNVAVARNIPGKRNYALLNTSTIRRNENVTWAGNTAFHDDGGALVLTDGGNSVPAASNALGVRPVFADEANRDFRIVED